MTLEDCRATCQSCTRCSICKWVPFNHVKRGDVSYICPSITQYGFHAYSGGGKLNVALSLMDKRSEMSRTVAEVAYKCNLCGACDYTCKIFRPDLDVAEVIEELRAACVAAGQTIPAHVSLVESMNKEGNSLGRARSERIDWTEGIDVKTVNNEGRGDVFFHVGCKAGFDVVLAKRTQAIAQALMASGVDLVTSGVDERCCGGRALELGYLDEGKQMAQALAATVKKTGAKTLVTSCAHCYSGFKYYYPREGIGLDFEVCHLTEFLWRLVEDGRLSLGNEIPLNVTYHDPCNLGRRSEPFIELWKGDKKDRPISRLRTGEKGAYEPPRGLLESIPGLKLTEMDRIKGYSWCCGSGAGVSEAFPDMTAFAGAERIKEAGCTGAEAIVTACPWCETSLRKAAGAAGNSLAVLDLVELVIRSAGGAV